MEGPDAQVSRECKNEFCFFSIFSFLISIRVLVQGEFYFMHLFPDTGWDMINRLDFFDFTTLFWRYRAERLKFEDFDSAVPDSVRALLGDDRRRFTTGLTLRRNSTDSPFFPSRGSEAEVSTSLSGTFLGGDESFSRNDLELSWYQRVGVSKFTFMLRSRFGFLQNARLRFLGTFLISGSSRQAAQN